MLALLWLAAACLGFLASGARAQQPIPGSPSPVDGPSPDIARPSGLDLAIARDGSGGLVYLKQVGGTPHVFLSLLVGGAFQAPVQIDSGLPGTASPPVIAAGNGGLLLVGFASGGELYVVGRSSQGAALSGPQGIASGGSDPSLSLTNFGKAYLAFTVPDGGGSDVRTAYYHKGAWALERAALNATPGDNAGTGAGRPEVAAAGDGVGIVVWGENGHVYSRRVWATSPSVVHEQADAAPAGCTEGTADEPVVAAGGDSSFAPVAFREQVTCGGHQQSRVFSNRLHASSYDGITNADGLSGAPADGAQDPQVTATEYGQGWVTSERTVSQRVVAQDLGSNGSPGGVGQINSLPITSAPAPVPATAGLYSTFIAWQQQPGASGPSEIRVRYAPDGSTLGSEVVASSSAQGPIDAADGIAAGGDVYGEAAVAWLQGAPGATTVMVEQMYQNPGPFKSNPFRYARTSQPVFSWTHPHGWGPMKYSLVVDGAVVNQTYGSAAAPAAPLPDGRQHWQVIAANPAGQQSHTRIAPVFIDTVTPHVKLRLRSPAVARTTLRANLAYTDPPPAGEPRSDASGVAKVLIRWGDGTSTKSRLGAHVITHAYRRTGRYRITVLVFDRAGNLTRLTSLLRVVGSPPNGKHATTTITTVAPAPSTTAPSSTTGGAAKPKAKR